MEQKALVETHDLVKVYSEGVEVRALAGVNIVVRPGEFISIMGPSGSGKSTLLNIIGALDLPTSGQIVVNGQDLTKVRDLDVFRACTVGFVFQLHNLIPTLTAIENVEVPMRGQKIGQRARRNRARELLELVGMGERIGHLPNQLSGGQRQRVATARSLANQPALVLADEPTGNLDSQSGTEVIALMRQLNHDLNTTFILVTHDPVVARQTDRTLVMRDGRIMHEDAERNLFEEDIAAFARSNLGRALAAGDKAALAQLGSHQRETLRQLLEGFV